MTEATDTLIDRLSRDLKPVKRLAPPYVRAGLWLAAIAVLGAALVAGFPTCRPSCAGRASPS